MRQAGFRGERAHAARQEAEARTVAKLVERLAARARNADDGTRQKVLRTLLARCDVARVPGDALKVRAVFRFGPTTNCRLRPTRTSVQSIAARSAGSTS